MNWVGKLLTIVALMTFAVPAVAVGLGDIHQSKLPHNQKVAKAYADIESLEPYVQSWQPQWNHRIPKSQVADRIKASLTALERASSSYSKNEELMLLVGLTAHFAYNVDVHGTYKITEKYLAKAQSLAPADFRPKWFLGVHQCEGGQMKRGMDQLLSIERALPWRELPSDFWDDYAFCADITDMPAHVLQAEDRAQQLDKSQSNMRNFLMEHAEKQFRTPDPSATYAAKDVWRSQKRGQDSWFLVNTMFGFGFDVRSEWKLQLPEVRKAICDAIIQIGPYQGETGKVFSKILVIVREPKPGESLDEFVRTIASDKTGVISAVTGCSFETCVGTEITNAQMYESEGGGHFVITAFEQNSPKYPGLLFEKPFGPPVSKNGQVQYFRPDSQLHRLPGTLYYFVGLDTPSSVLPSAKADYKSFLKTMQVE